MKDSVIEKKLEESYDSSKSIQFKNNKYYDEDIKLRETEYNINQGKKYYEDEFSDQS